MAKMINKASSRNWNRAKGICMSGKTKLNVMNKPKKAKSKEGKDWKKKMKEESKKNKKN